MLHITSQKQEKCIDNAVNQQGTLRTSSSRTSYLCEYLEENDHGHLLLTRFNFNPSMDK